MALEQEIMEAEAKQEKKEAKAEEKPASEDEKLTCNLEDCIYCGLCAKNCPEGAISMVDNLPVIDYEKCVHCEACVKDCPTGCLKTAFFPDIPADVSSEELLSWYDQ